MHNVVSTVLDPTLQNADAAEFEASLNHKVKGQSEAAKIVTNVIQSYMAGLNDPGRPIATLLFLGPTGTGKTRSLRPCWRTSLAHPRGKERQQQRQFAAAPTGFSVLPARPVAYLVTTALRKW